MKRLGGALLLALWLSGCATTPQPATGPVEEEKSAKINAQLGVAYFQQGQLEQALSKLQKAVKQDPQLADAHAGLAVVYERLGETEQAASHHLRAIELAPQDSSMLNNYGRFLCNQNKLEEAEERFQQAARNPLYRNPELPLGNAGLCFHRAGKIDKAEDYLLRALQANPRFPPALLRMAEIRYSKGSAMSARGFYQRYLAVAPQTAESLWLGIQIERELGDRDAVGSYALLLKGKFPDSAEARRLIEQESK